MGYLEFLLYFYPLNTTPIPQIAIFDFGLLYLPPINEKVVPSMNNCYLIGSMDNLYFLRGTSFSLKKLLTIHGSNKQSIDPLGKNYLFKEQQILHFPFSCSLIVHLNIILFI